MQSKEIQNPDPTQDRLEESTANLPIGVKIGRWNVSKSYISVIFCVSGVVLLGLFILACFKDSSTWIANLIGIVGGLASLFGIYLTICQVIETKKDVEIVGAIANTAKIAAEETRQSLRKTLSVAQVAKYCERIKLIQEKLNNKELPLVIHLIQDLQDAIIELQKYLKSVNFTFNEKGIADHITKMGMNLNFIRTAIDRNNEKYKKGDILKDFDDLYIVLSELKAKLKTHDNEHPRITI